MSNARNLSKLKPSSSGLIEIDDVDSSVTQKFSFRNRIINGDMMIDQRNAGAVATSNYVVDRWRMDSNVGSNKATLQQNQNSATPPSGFSYYAGMTAAGTYTPTAGDILVFDQIIEGYNISDLGWGTANAQPITLSFWVRSSIAGLHGGALVNSGSTRAYPYTYTISSANSWEYKTITISGDTGGTWPTVNGIGIGVYFNMGCGSTYSGTAGVWTGGAKYSATGVVNPMTTSGATFYITGVQLEKGSTATSFDYRPYGTELALCQRYFQKSYDIGTVPGTSVGSVDSCIEVAWASESSNGIGASSVILPVVMRATPTLTVYDAAGNSGKATTLSAGASQTNNQNLNTSNATTTRVFVRIYGIACAGFGYQYTVASEL
jgi:hypothetical protein